MLAGVYALQGREALASDLRAMADTFVAAARRSGSSETAATLAGRGADTTAGMLLSQLDARLAEVSSQATVRLDKEGHLSCW